MGRLSTLEKNVYFASIALFFLAHTQGTTSVQQNALTFTWYDNVRAENVHIDRKYLQPTKHLAEQSKLYRKINGALILEATNFTSEFPDTIAWREYPGFVDTVFYSYREHHNLIIRPDDIWTAVIVQFSLYVNGNAEALRHSFVKFEGKKKLEVTFASRIDEVPFDIFIQKILALIDENIDPSISPWVLPNFTTTTENDKITAGAALMATLQKYFEYSGVFVLCGIPQVTILGNVDDWKEIRQRVERLKEFELDGKNVMAKWSSMLGRILDQFISVKEGNEKDDEFWKQAIRVDYKIVYRCGSYNETYLNGWITAFSAFGDSGNWQGERDDNYDYNISPRKLNTDSTPWPWLSIPTNKITSGMVQVPIQIYDEYADEDERDYTGAIITGHMGYTVHEDEKTLQPLSGWAMAITNNVPHYLIFKINQQESSTE